MKIPIAGILSLLAVVAVGATFNLSFDPSPTPNVMYRVYSSTNLIHWKFEVATSNRNITISNVPASVVAFGVSATNASGESTKATAEILFAPMNLKIVEQ